MPSRSVSLSPRWVVLRTRIVNQVKVKTEAEETKASLEQRLMQAVHDLTVRETEFKEKLEEDERFEEEVERKEHQTQEEQFRTRAFLEAREVGIREFWRVCRALFRYCLSGLLSGMSWNRRPRESVDTRRRCENLMV